jgi:hypothetical protein
MRGSKKDISTREARDSGDCTVPRPILNVMYLTIGVSSVSSPSPAAVNQPGMVASTWLAVS